MKIVPSILRKDINESEKKVFQSFKRLQMDEAEICFHSLNLPDHRYKRKGEIDFLLLTKRGILVLEVKGGNISVNDGAWTYSNSKGKSFTKHESPFEQAEGNMYSLLDKLTEKEVTPYLNQTLFGYGVIFDKLFEEESVEWNENTFIDPKDFYSSEDLGQFINGLYDYFETKRKCRSLSNDDIIKISNYLRPSFDPVPDLRAYISNTNYLINELTTNQYKILDVIEGNDRIIISGGAGTGKTYLAMEVARRHAIKNDKVLLSCKSSILASFLKSILQKVNVDVYNVDELAKNKDQYSTSNYDLLIIDEAQDVLEWDYLDLFNSFLKDGLEKGKWLVLHDINNQSGLFGKYSAEAFEYLSKTAPVNAKLTDNCRNSKPVIEHIQSITGADTGKEIIGSGPEVGWDFYKNDHEAHTRVSATINDLGNHNLDLSDIALLVDTLNENTRKLIKKGLGNNYVYLENDAVNIPPNKIKVSEIKQFKGLEAEVVVVFITENDLDNFPIEKFYVGMSRAKTKLNMIVPKAYEEIITDKFLKSIK
jgi:tRNA A37 threonylcarbamoyladenosine biosynthesis protein TsaE